MTALFRALLLVLAWAPAAAAQDLLAPAGERHLLVYFGYAYCPDATPTGLQTIIEALEAAGLGDRAGGVFVSVDPGRDTPEMLTAYVAGFDRRLVGVTGTPADLERTAASLGARFDVPPPGPDGSYHVAHTTKIHLVSPSGDPLESFPEGTPARTIADALRRHLDQGAKK